MRLWHQTSEPHVRYNLRVVYQGLWCLICLGGSVIPIVYCAVHIDVPSHWLHILLHHIADWSGSKWIIGDMLRGPVTGLVYLLLCVCAPNSILMQEKADDSDKKQSNFDYFIQTYTKWSFFGVSNFGRSQYRTALIDAGRFGPRLKFPRRENGVESNPK